MLQRAPAQAIVWGHTSGASVNTTFDGQTYTAHADGNGTWRQKLPATAASDKNYTLSFVSSAGERASMSGVLFGGEGSPFGAAAPSFGAAAPLLRLRLLSSLFIVYQTYLSAGDNQTVSQHADGFLFLHQP